MTSIAVNIALGIAIPAFIGLLLWRNHEALLAKYDSIAARKKVVVPMSENPIYYWKKQGENVSPAIRQKVYKRDNWECGYCGRTVIDGNATTTREHLKGLTGARPGNVDHRYVPEEYGGRALYDDKVDSKDNNLITACQPCNVRKKAKIDNDTFKWLARRGETICLRND